MKTFENFYRNELRRSIDGWSATRTLDVTDACNWLEARHGIPRRGDAHPAFHWLKVVARIPMKVYPRTFPRWWWPWRCPRLYRFQVMYALFPRIARPEGQPAPAAKAAAQNVLDIDSRQK